MELEIEISKRNLFIVIAALFMFSGILLVNAYNDRWNELPRSPANIGHSPDELSVNWNNVLNKPGGFQDNSDAGTGACSSGYMKVGGNCKPLTPCTSSQVTRWTGSSFKCVNNPPPPPPPPTYSWKYFARHNRDGSCTLPLSGSGVIRYTTTHLNMLNEPYGWRTGHYLECARDIYGCIKIIGTSRPSGKSCSSSLNGRVCIAGSYSGSSRGIWYFTGGSKYKCSKD